MNTTYEPIPGTKWTYGDEVGNVWFNGREWRREVSLFGPCPACGTVCGSYGGGWRCHALHCYYNADNPAPSMGTMPDWWNTGIQVFRDGSSWCATDVGFTNLQEFDAGFGDTPAAAVKDLRIRLAASRDSGLPASQPAKLENASVTDQRDRLAGLLRSAMAALLSKDVGRQVGVACKIESALAELENKP